MLNLRSRQSKAAMRSADMVQPTNPPTPLDSDPTTIDRHPDDSMLSGSPGDTHDLSLALEGNRNSVVDHMLLSLDSMPGASGFYPAPAPTSYNPYHRTADVEPSSPDYGRRRRSHTHSASRTSDYDLDVQDIYTPFSKPWSRRDLAGAQQLSRQSYRDLSRQSTRESLGREHAASQYERNHTAYGDERNRLVSRHQGRNDSNGSIISDADGGLEALNHRGNRSAGSEYAQNGLSEQRVTSASILGRGRPVPGGYWHTDSAPEPAILSGPRRRGETASGSSHTDSQMHPPLPGYEAQDVSKPKRRSSIRSATSRLSRRTRPDSEAASRMNVADIFANHLENRTETDALAAPSPSAGYRKDLISSASNQNLGKEKTGFFRRVFGSSKNSPATAAQPEEPSTPTRPATQQRQRASAPSHPSDPSSDRDRPRTRASLRSQSSASHVAAQLKLQPPTVPPEVPPMPAEHQTLNKKPSSFFRRRKKSISETRPPVTILQQHPKVKNLPAGADVAPALPSPSISSLRKVMNPYLSDAQPAQHSPEKSNLEYSETQRSGSEATAGESIYGQPHGEDRPSTSNFGTSGHAPYGGSTIRQVKSGSPLDEEFSSSVLGGTASEEQGQPAEDSKSRGKLWKSRPGTAKLDAQNERGASEQKALRKLSPTQTSFGSHGDLERPKTSPTGPYFTGETKENVNPALPPHAGTLRKGQSGNLRDLAANDGKKMLSPVTDYSPVTSDFTVTNSPLARLGQQAQTDARLKKQASSRSNRIWITDDSEEAKPPRRIVSPLTLPMDSGAGEDSFDNVSPLESPSPLDGGEVFHSATSLPIVQVEGDILNDDLEHNRNGSGDTTGSDVGVKITAAESVAIDTDAPQIEDQDRAAKLFSGDESFIPKARAAAWLGETSFVAARTRKAYMDLFDWSGLSILNAFRELCLRLIVKAESQQLDRIIDAFSKRWCACNPSHGFKAADVVHTISYSILMLNTDLHIADMDSRMTRQEFVRNTLPTIRRIADIAAADNIEQSKGPQLSLNVPGASPPSSPLHPPEQPHLNHAATEPVTRHSLEAKRSKNRLSLLPGGLDLAISGYDAALDNCTVLVNKQHDGTMKSWESQVEVVLREFYSSIKQTPLPLHGSAAQGKETHDGRQTSNNLTVSSASGLRRTPSVLSKAPSDNVSYRGRSSDMRSATSRWPVGSKTRSRPRLYNTSTIGSSRTSLDDQSIWSPTASSTWSKYSLAKSQTQPSSWNTGAGSMSVESFGSGFHADGYSQSIGFANALSQAIIREEHAAGLNTDNNDDLEEFGKVRPLLEDESLELDGAPWAKEGLVKHKHHLETIDKKAKDRAWNECFAVVEKGYLRLFSFNQSSKSIRKNKKHAGRSGGAVGGGNWMDNAESLGCFLLRQTLASTLPPPGYSKLRPHVWALSLPTGAVHLFQVGTDDISNEFVKTANYWSARLSKEPLVGGVSNIEYGWSENVINPALVSRAGSVTPSLGSSSTTAMHAPRPSVQSSLQGSIRGSSIDGGSGSSGRVRMPGDKATISQWTPPVQSMMASQLMEVDQLKALSAYVRAVEDDLDRHNGLRQAMGVAFSARHPNGQKALANWEKKSAYLLREIVKFKTYVSSLNDAQVARERVERERAEKRAVEAAERPLSSHTGVVNRSSDHYGDELAPETAEAVRRAENAEYDD